MPYTQATHTFIIRTPIGPTDAPEHVIVSTYASASIETWSDHDKEVPQPCVFPANFTERNRCTWMPNDGRDVLRPSDMRTADSPSGQLVATSHQPPRPTSHGGWDHLYRASSRHHKHRQGVIGRREHQAVGMTAILRTQLLLSASSKFARGGLLVILFSVVDAVASGRRRLRLSTSRSTRRFWPM